MFGLSVNDQLRLNSEHVTRNYALHSQAAERLARMTLRARLVILALSGIAFAAAIITVYREGREYEIVAAILSGVALAAIVAYVAVGLEGRVAAHRSLAHRLWLIAERHRSLLAEIHDGLLEEPVILERREDLTRQVHAVYEQTFPSDEPAFETARQPDMSAAMASAPAAPQPNVSARH
jgi:hypothetical protein